MLTIYLKIALRNIVRNKTFSLINIMGLSIGLVSFLGISLYVIDELSYDRFHKNSNRIYRAIISKTDSDGKSATLYSLEKRGFIREGYFADLTIVDLNSRRTVSKDNILYKCGWSPLQVY